jgi:hypothetical protein
MADPQTDNTFTCEVRRHVYDESGKQQFNADGTPLLGDLVGTFVFKVPTLWDIQEQGVRRAALLMDQRSVDTVTTMLAEVRACLPHATLKKPDSWDWNALTLEDMESVSAVYREYTAGLQAFRRKRP